MPNHVTHRMTVLGSKEAIDDFLSRFCILDAEDRAHRLDFGKIVPVPDCIAGSESSSAVTDGLIVLGRGDLLENQFMPTTLAAMREQYGWLSHCKSDEEAKAVLLQRSPDAIEKAQKAIAAYEETGHTSWYGWNRANWGTKWDCYDAASERISDTEMLLIFDTAWSPPEPIFRKVAAMCPQVGAKIVAFDEGWNFAFIGALEGGAFLGAEVPATAEMYEAVYGEPPKTEVDDADIAQAVQ